MTYEEILDTVFDLILGTLSDEEAEAEIEKLLAKQSPELAEEIRDTIASLFAQPGTKANDKAD